jgi:hypothetical protein
MVGSGLHPCLSGRGIATLMAEQIMQLRPENGAKNPEGLSKKRLIIELIQHIAMWPVLSKNIG